MDDPNQHLVTVNATNHHGYLINRLWEFIQNKHKTDICILSNGQMIQAHQVILEVFTSQEQLGYAALHNRRNLDMIVEFMYTGVIRVQPEDLDSLLHLATDLGFGMLVDALKAAKSSSCQITPDKMEQNSNETILALLDSGKYAVYDSKPPTLIIPMSEPCYNICQVKQELLNQSIIEDFNLSDTQNVVALENGEGQSVECLVEIHEEEPDIVKHESNVDINVSKVVAGGNESRPGPSHGHPPVPSINESVSSCANPTSPSHYPLTKRTRKTYSKCDSLLDPDWKGSTANANMSSKELSTHEGVKSQLPSHDQILPADASAVGLTKTCNQRELKNFSTFHNGNAAKCSKLNNINHKVEIGRLEETKCAGDNQSKIECPVCSKLVAKKYLKKHMLVHTGERPYVCPQCPKSFFNPSNLSIHMRIHTGERPYSCPQCPKTFIKSSTLSDHMRVHTGECPYVCPQCPKTFSVKSALTRHKRLHTGERPYVCPQCPKTFSFNSDLTRHKRLHTDEQPYA